MENENTPQEQVVQDNVLTEKEKHYLENYNGENTFLKSLSDNYKDKGNLTEKQILALRKSQEESTNRLSRCPHTELDYHQVCKFSDKRFDEFCEIKIVSIRPKALCLLDEKNNRKAWVPSKAIKKQVIIEANTNEEMIEVSLEDWFTRDDGFWRENTPYVPRDKEQIKPQEKSNTESVKDDFDAQVQAMYDEPEDDGLPF